MSTARGAKGSLGPPRGTESNTNGRGVWHGSKVCKVLRTGVQFAGAELNIRKSHFTRASGNPIYQTPHGGDSTLACLEDPRLNPPIRISQQGNTIRQDNITSISYT